MKKGLIYFLGIIILILTVGCHAQKQPEPRKLVRISVLPAYSLEMMTNKYVSLTEYLSKETGYRIEFVSSLSYSNFLSVVETSRVDIAFVNPFVYQILANTKKASPLVQAVNPDGTLVYRGIIIAHKDSGINKVSDLRDKKVMTLSKKSLGAYLGQAKLLKDAGIDPERDLVLLLGIRQDEIAIRVYKQKVDAGFIREDILKDISHKIDLSKLTIIAKTEEFPTWLFVAFKETDSEVIVNIKRALLKLSKDDPEHEKIIKNMGIEKFIDAVPGKYDVVANLIKTLNLPY